MSKSRRTGTNRVTGKGKQMEGEEMAMGGPDLPTMQVAAQQTVLASASVTTLGWQAPNGVGPALPVRASLPGDGQHWPPGVIPYASAIGLPWAKAVASTNTSSNLSSEGREQHDHHKIGRPVRPTPIDPTNNNSTPSQPISITLHPVHAYTYPFNSPSRPRLWRRAQVQSVWSPLE